MKQHREKDIIVINKERGHLKVINFSILRNNVCILRVIIQYYIW